MTLFDQIKEVATPFAFFIFFVVQKYDALKAKRAKEEADRQLQAKLKEQDELAANTARDLKLATERTARELAQKLEEQNRATEAAALEVKTTLEAADQKQLAKLELIHIDSNSKMAAAKKKISEQALWRAAHTGLPEDAAAAREADRDYQDHLAAQADADERLRLFRAAHAAHEMGLATTGQTGKD